MAATLYDLIPRDEKFSNDLLLGRFLDYAADRRLQLYPAQESAIALIKLLPLAGALALLSLHHRFQLMPGGGS